MPHPYAFYRPGEYPADHDVGYLMKRIVNGLAHDIDALLTPQGLTHAQWMPLYKLHLGQGSTVAELADMCLMDAGAMTRTLDRLERKGLVRRTRSVTDRRVVDLALTPEGRCAAARIPFVLCEVLDAHLKGFSKDECSMLQSFLSRMLVNAAGSRSQRVKQTTQ
ncbi:MarR family winged helix-turn-helix transcriptional regulator [Pantoea sp. 18069]|uniref:MarR family winged helix-turn-helix transcriptional regulator n=1 Tax=Pantoea sp. 18069 TaxID=2681415 RepID=UPI00190F6B81|nr:MarR family transcriptional regulator [Pantoea sp. 18069]